MLPYAEQFLEQHQANQWFIRFFVDDALKQNHMEWFLNQGLQLTQVRTHEFDQPVTDFYHVPFASDADVRLKAYSEKFEDADGVSLNPDVYQLYEWSHAAWCESGLQNAWLRHVEKNHLTASL